MNTYTFSRQITLFTIYLFQFNLKKAPQHIDMKINHPFRMASTRIIPILSHTASANLC